MSLAVVLSRRDFREYDQLVSVYTKEKGKLELLAAGIKKSISKNAAALQPFFIVDLDYAEGREWPRLTKVLTVVSFVEILKKGDALDLLGKSLQAVDSFIRVGVPDAEVWQLLAEWLEFLNASKSFSPFIYSIFLLRLGKALGYQPALAGCVVCGVEDTAYFSPQAGGVLCAKHIGSTGENDKNFPLSREAAGAFQTVFQMPLSVVNNALLMGKIVPLALVAMKAFVAYHVAQGSGSVSLPKTKNSSKLSFV